MADENKNRMGTTWLVAGGFLLLVVVAALAVVFFPAGGDDEPETNTTEESIAEDTSEPTSEPTEEQLPTGDAAEDSGDGGDNAAIEPCDLDEADSDFPASAPEFRWEDHPNGVTLPVSDEHGPVVRDGDFWRCTSQTPTGAAFAGASLFVAFAEGEREAAEDSPRARELFEARGEGTDVVVRGFQITSSSETTATIDYWMEPISESTALSVELFLVWNDEANDWRLDYSDGEPNYTVIKETSDYTEWR